MKWPVKAFQIGRQNMCACDCETVLSPKFNYMETSLICSKISDNFFAPDHRRKPVAPKACRMADQSIATSWYTRAASQCRLNHVPQTPQSQQVNMKVKRIDLEDVLHIKCRCAQHGSRLGQQNRWLKRPACCGTKLELSTMKLMLQRMPEIDEYSTCMEPKKEYSDACVHAMRKIHNSWVKGKLSARAR